MAVGGKSQVQGEVSNEPRPSEGANESPSRLTRSALVPYAGLAIWAFGLGLALGLDDPRRRFVPYVLGTLAAWVGLALTTRARPTGHLAWIVVLGGLGARAAALGLAPAFSEDLFRHVWDGRLALWAGPWAAYVHPPAEGPALSLPPGLLDEAWLRINHPELATVYPPITQAAAAAGVALGGLLAAPATGIKLVLVAADLAAWRLVHRAQPSAGPAWALCPLLVLEVAREGHADALSALGLAVAAVGFTAGRPRRGYAGLAFAGASKLTGLVLAPWALSRTRRGWTWLLPAFALVALPVGWSLEVGEAAGAAAYATRWRSGDGAFSILLAAAEALLGGDWARLGGLTLTRHQLARGLAGALFLAAYAGLIARGRALVGPGFARGAGLLLTLLLLLSPTLHPWYPISLWPLVCVARFPGRAAAIWLAVGAPALHHAVHVELLVGVWTESAALRALLHGPAWALLVGGLARARAARGPEGRRSTTLGR